MQVKYIDHSGNGDLSVVNAARVSFANSSDWVPRIHNGEAKVLSERDTKLIRYLAKHKHKSPFNHSFITLYVRAPIFVARQLQKHEYMVWNEVSKRYTDKSPDLYEPEWRSRSKDKKQGSGGPVEISLEADMMYHATMRNAMTTYELMIKEGIAPEQARVVLPQNMYTEWFWSGTLFAWAKMCGLRLKADAQLEAQMIAQQCEDIIMNLFPVSWEALRMYEDD